MVNPGAFQGSRREFMLSQKAAYSEAVEGNFAAEAVSIIQRRYFKHFPVDLPHDVEPSEEHLNAVDDDAIDPDYEEPDAEKLSPEEYAEAFVKLGHRQKILEFRRAQIKRWLAYQHMKDQDINPKDSGALSPYSLLLEKLTGKATSRPRLKPPVNVWRKNHKESIEVLLKRRAASEGVGKAQLAALREKIARELFNNLPEDERRTWRQRAASEHAEAEKAWKKELASPCSTSPEDRQRCILGLVQFAQPILDLICEATGWKATLIAGGPEPAQNGLLNVISIHSGTTTGEVRMNFGHAERARFKTQIISIYGSFLQKCYSPEECRARALSDDTTFMPMSSLETENDSFTYDLIEQQAPQALASPPSCEPTSAASGTLPIRAAPHPASLTPAPTCVAVSAPGPTPTAPVAPIPSPHPLASGQRAPSLPPTPSGRPSPPNSPPPSPLHHRSLPTSPTHPEAAKNASPAPDLSNPQDTLLASASPASTGGVGTNFRGKKRGQKAGVGSAAGDDQRPQKRAKPTPPNPSPSTHTSIPPSIRNQPKRGGPKSKQAAATLSATPSQLAPGTTIPSTSPSRSTSGFESPPGAPKWFSDALSLLRHDDIEGHPLWEELVEKWAIFELEANFQGASKVNSYQRPKPIGDWIQRARSTTWRPEIANLPEYGAGFMDWWASLQPKWRVTSNGKILFEKVEGDWDVLRKPGQNGLLSVMAGLFYWGCEVKASQDGQDEWLVAVADFLTAYDQLLI